MTINSVAPMFPNTRWSPFGRPGHELTRGKQAAVTQLDDVGARKALSGQ